MASFGDITADNLGSNLSKEQLESFLADFDIDKDIPDFFTELPFSDEVSSELVVTCKGNINDVDLQQKLKSMQQGLSALANTGRRSFGGGGQQGTCI